MGCGVEIVNGYNLTYLLTNSLSMHYTTCFLTFCRRKRFQHLQNEKQKFRKMFNIVLLLKVPHDPKKLTAKEDPFSGNKQNLLAIVGCLNHEKSEYPLYFIYWYRLVYSVFALEGNSCNKRTIHTLGGQTDRYLIASLTFKLCLLMSTTSNS